ncbi:MAG: 30S ribosome-binding factor RbfA [Aquisalimonadaceae bacterium]
MAKDYPRARRVADQIQRELATLIRDSVRDPRVTGSVTVSEVEVSRDMAHAKVHMTVLGAEAAETEEAVDVLNGAAGFLRRELGRRMMLRSVPALHFFHDLSFDRGAELTRLIDSVVADDRERGSED